MVKVNKVINGYLYLSGNARDQEKIKAAASIKALLSNIDLSAEVVPENNLGMLTRLLSSLKGASLNKNEVTIINEIINS